MIRVKIKITPKGVPRICLPNMSHLVTHLTLNICITVGANRTSSGKLLGG